MDDFWCLKRGPRLAGSFGLPCSHPSGLGSLRRTLVSPCFFGVRAKVYPLESAIALVLRLQECDGILNPTVQEIILSRKAAARQPTNPLLGRVLGGERPRKDRDQGHPALASGIRPLKFSVRPEKLEPGLPFIGLTAIGATNFCWEGKPPTKIDYRKKLVPT